MGAHFFDAFFVNYVEALFFINTITSRPKCKKLISKAVSTYNDIDASFTETTSWLRTFPSCPALVPNS